MIDLKLIRAKPEQLERLLKTKRPEVELGPVLALDEEHRKLQTRLDALRKTKRELSARVPTLKEGPRKELLKELKSLDTQITGLEQEERSVGQKLEKTLLNLPNPPRSDVKFGRDETGNEVLKTMGDPTEFAFPPRDYLALATIHEVADIRRAAKLSGSRFVYLLGKLVHLEFALIRYAFDVLEREGFLPVVPPVLVNRPSMEGMGYLGHGGDSEVYHLPKDDLYLVGTAEQALGPMFQNEIMPFESLPRRFAGFSTCFRREAGSYGKDTKGFLRVHQFDKVEMFSFTTPETSDDEHDFFLSLEERLMGSLGIPYRVVKMCTADLGDPAARKYDIEAWLPGQQAYRETHSCSTCTDFQSRRLKIRFRKKGGGIEFVHTVNGTAFAIGRTLIAIMENFQSAQGSIAVPEVLRPYCGFSVIERGQESPKR